VGKYSVLIVDDSALMRQMTAALFKEDPQFMIAGMANNGIEALDKLMDLQPDFVIMDVEMPEMDGLNALRQIMKFHPLPVIMLSSYTSEGSVQTLEAMQSGAVDFFHKDILFQKPLSRRTVEDFLFRCKVAVQSWLTPTKSLDFQSRDATVQVLLESLSYCMKIEDELRYAQEKLSATLRKQNGLIAKFKEEHGDFVHTSFEGELLGRIGFNPQSIIGKKVGSIFPPEAADRIIAHYRRAWSGEEMVSFETEWDGINYLSVLRPIWRQDKIVEVIALYVDITDQKRTEERMLYLMNHDQLTGLPNRRFFGQLLRGMSELSSFSLILIDLDNFKLKNDTLGHEIGDHLLQMVARRLKRFSTMSDCPVARVGGDEFIFILPDCSQDEVKASADQLMLAISRPIRIDDHEIHLTASVGISRFPEDAEDTESLLKYADMALFNAKEMGVGHYSFYSHRLNEKLHRRMEIEGRLRKALEQREFSLHFQPVIDLAERRVAGMETLIRWSNPDLGAVPPMDFIPIAEETGLIHEIGAWVLEQACHQSKAWQDAGLAPVTVAVNLSSKQFYDPRLKETIVRILHETGLQPGQLELEITESMTMNVGTALAVLGELKALGVKIAMDDFGTGYSSLGYLKQFPIDKLKIDRSFVKEIVHNPVDAAIVNTIVSMANNLKLGVVAEGVEDEETLAVLRELGCGMVQGYLFSKPVDAEQARKLLSDGHAIVR